MHSTTYFSFFALLASTLSGYTLAETTNCKSNIKNACETFTNPNQSTELIKQLFLQVATVDDNRLYQNNELIACVDGALVSGSNVVENQSLCAFLQNVSGGITGREIKVFSNQLIAFGCKACGSIPTSSLNVADGELTFGVIQRGTQNDVPCAGGVLGQCFYGVGF